MIYQGEKDLCYYNEEKKKHKLYYLKCQIDRLEKGPKGLTIAGSLKGNFSAKIAKHYLVDRYRTVPITPEETFEIYLEDFEDYRDHKIQVIAETDVFVKAAQLLFPEELEKKLSAEGQGDYYDSKKRMLVIER